MGCVHGKCCRRYRPCCCHYQSSSNGDPADTAGDDLGRCRVHEASQIDADIQSGYAAVASHNLSLHYAALTQRGHYPDSPDRANQDSFCIKPQFQGKPDLHFFGVFDGHGQFGTECANFTCGRLPEILASDARLIDDPVKALHSAFVATNSQLHESEIDDTMSGTTAVTVLVTGGSLYIANAGDSRAVAGVWNGDCVAAVELSTDQTPFRTDEYERVKACGARVLSVDQVEGVKDPGVQSWGDEENDDGDPPRLWVQNGMYPGTAFTRSVGDSTAEAIGVIADPEVMTVKITPSHRFFVIASDGVFEFLSSQVVVDMVARFADPREGCSAIAAESYKLWLEHENRTDDITIIIVLIKSLPNSGSGATGEAGRTNTKTSVLISDKESAERRIFFGSEACHPKRGNLPELLSYPAGFPTEKSPASIAPSPTPSLLKVIRVKKVLFALDSSGAPSSASIPHQYHASEPC